jgi:hypothetical protein
VRKKGCILGKYTIEEFVCNKNLDLLKYAHENECFWDKEQCLLTAIKYKHYEIISYINTFF